MCHSLTSQAIKNVYYVHVCKVLWGIHSCFNGVKIYKIDHDVIFEMLYLKK